MLREQRLKSLAGYGKVAEPKGITVWVPTIDNLVKWKLKSIHKDGRYCTVINDLGGTRKYRKTRVYLNEQMAQLRFVRDTDKYFQPISEKFKPSLNKVRIIEIRKEISDIEPAWFI